MMMKSASPYWGCNNKDCQYNQDNITFIREQNMYSESDTDDWSNVGDDYIDDNNEFNGGDNDDGGGSGG